MKEEKPVKVYEVLHGIAKVIHYCTDSINEHERHNNFQRGAAIAKAIEVTNEAAKELIKSYYSSL